VRLGAQSILSTLPFRKFETLTISTPAARAASAASPLSSVDGLIEGLGSVGYIASRRIATALYMAVNLQKPILVEGSAGVGKTELALSTARLLGLPLIRMQCYEGLDESKALYEWKYGKQLLYTQILKDRMGESLADAPDMDAAMERLHGMGDLFFSEPFLEPRPLMKALKEDDGCVLLIDEIDKSDEAFEAFLLEVLSAYQVSVPELGVVKAKTPPFVFLTSNNVRDLGDALKRRCLHLHIPLPEPALEERIVATRVPDIETTLTKQLVAFVQTLRTLDLRKAPSISETVDWARALILLHADSLDPAMVRDTLNVILKFEQDITAVEPQIVELLARRPS
jgi:MoxR-like ATPase